MTAQSEPCAACGGSGKTKREIHVTGGRPVWIDDACAACRGTGTAQEPPMHQQLRERGERPLPGLEDAE